jgi:DNA/RNA endonuclease G (NUC1)
MEGKDTEDFTVPTNYWRIVYTTNAENEQYALFSFFVYPSGETKSFVASVTFVKSGTDTTYARAGPGDFWIKVLAANLRTWTIEVQTQQ